MPLLWRSSRESRSERCKRAFLLAPICKVLLAPTLVCVRPSYHVLAVPVCVSVGVGGCRL